MQTLPISLPVGIGETAELKLCNRALTVTTLTITTAGGTTIRVPLAAFAEISMTAGHDLADTGFVVTIDAPDEPSGLRLAKSGDVHG